jgi:lipid II:glycine glycyltransferase (peptidoglycan interpeptide bridge formation enzyme)
LSAEQLGEACKVWIAYVGDTPVAGSIVLQYDNVNDSRGAIDREALGTSGANDLLQTQSIKDACEKGCRYYHLGETGANESLARYKERFGARPTPYAEYTLERLPLMRMDSALRTMVKKAIGFKDH